MRLVSTFSLAVTICLAALALVSTSSPATAEEDGRRLSLATDYLFQKVDIDTSSLPTHRISLNITLDDKRGKGTLGIDPNTTRFNVFGDEAGSTEIATRSSDVTLSALEREDSTGKGRRLYEIKGVGLKGRLFLVFAGERAESHRLLVADKDGTVKQVLPLRRVAQDK